MDTAVVTGATRGVGRAVAELFAERGVHVVACARDGGALEELPDELEGAGGTITAVRADVRDEFDVERLMETAARAGGGEGIDCVVANAAVYHGEAGETPLSGTAYSAFDDTLRTNVRGVFATVSESLPHLRPDARVLVPSGGVAREAVEGYGAYAVSKAGAEAVARQFAAEADPAVCVLDLGKVATELSGTGAGRTPEEIAPMVWWAATDADPVDGERLGLADWKRATR